MVPKEWVTPPDVDTADGELLEAGDALDSDDEDSDERSGMMDSQRRRQRREGGADTTRLATADNAGRNLPVAERAPV